MKNIFGTFLLLSCKCWPEAPMACYDWKLHSKPSTTIQLHVYVVKSDLVLLKILKFLDFRKITLAFLLHNGWSHYINGIGSGF